MYHDMEDELVEYVSARKAGRPMGPNAPHYPNKEEAKEIRRLMQKSGKPKEDVLADVKNRRKIAEARKSCQQPKGNKNRLAIRRLKRDFACELGLLPTHPMVTDALNKFLSSSEGILWKHRNFKAC